MDAPLSTLPPIEPVQVWFQLTADRRGLALSYLAQWVLNRALAPPHAALSEVIHEHANPSSQTPPRASSTPGPDLHSPIDPHAGA